MPIRMRTMLLLLLLSTLSGMVALSVAVLRSVLRQEIRRELNADLVRSVSTFRNIQAQREQMLRREVALLAALPVLKSLMTAPDDRTIRDGAAEFYNLSGGDLFVLAAPSGRPIAVFESGQPQDPDQLRPPPAFDAPGKTAFYRTRAQRLYEVAFQPLYFGSESRGVLLGYVVLGYQVDRRLAEEISQAASAQVIFYAGDTLIASTLANEALAASPQNAARLRHSDPQGDDVWLAGEHFVHASVLQGDPAGPRLQMVALESFDKASQYVTHLNLTLLFVGLVLLLLGAALAVYVSTSITRPLDRLVASARALGVGNFEYHIQRSGARELRELADAFDRMRIRLKNAREELVASERLATIGRMASSISHDLRHYLSAVYANAEFLGYDSTHPEERQELMNEVRAGVRGMTDLIDSLLLFSRTGEVLQPSCESVAFLLERALGLVRAHPDAHGVRFTVSPLPPSEIWLDPRRVERAIYNLLLNAFQAARHAPHDPEVTVTVEELEESIAISIADNGPGVPQPVQQKLFQPFVSVGKVSGTGLGLALALKVAQEHGGTVTLEESREGLTRFRLTLSRIALRPPAEPAHHAALTIVEPAKEHHGDSR